MHAKCLMFAAVAAVCTAVIADEEPLQFRTRLETVHESDRREAGLKPAKDEFVFADGVSFVAYSPDPLVHRGLEDFADYLGTSMGVKVEKGGRRVQLAVKLDGKLSRGEYHVKVSRSGVGIRAADGRAAMQALFHLEDLMNLRRAPFLKVGTETRRPKFGDRMIHAGWGIDQFPDAHLATIAHAGYSAILFYLDGMDVTHGGRTDVVGLIDRAAAWGLDSYLYSSLNAKLHPDDPGSDAQIENTYGAAAKKYSKAKGFVIVPESCYFDSHDPRVSLKGGKRPDGKPYYNPSRFPCTDYPQWLAKIEKTVRKYIPRADFVFWTYNFFWTPQEDRFIFIDNVTTSTTLNISFALGKPGHMTRLGYNVPMDDYSISEPGPSDIFKAEAEHAHARGLRVFTMCNTGGRTWDFGCCPYEPVPQQWKRRYEALDAAKAQYGLSGLMESHHYGFVPNFIAELSKEAFTEGGMDFTEHLKAIAARDFGAKHADETVAVWADLSEAIKDYVATSENQYGPFRVGPAYPFNAMGEFLKFGDWPDFRGWICNPNYLYEIPWGGAAITLRRFDMKRLAVEIEMFPSAGKRFVEGAAKLRVFAAELPGERAARARREAGVVEYIGRSFLTCANVKKAAVQEIKWLDKSLGEAEHAAAKKEILAIAKEEYENTRAALALVKADSLLGWECSMKYGGGADRIEWKLKRMEELYGAEW